jgi:predicted acylesterase/phospholipase RssA
MNDISSLRVDPTVTQVDRLFQGWRPEGCDRVALVLQGGGALGAYQAGVYQALHECGIEPDWVSGVSIGAINAAIIAGNMPDWELQKWKTLRYQALAKVPEASLSEEERRLKQELSDLPEISILHIIYQQKAYERHAKDYEFSGTSMREHWPSGYEDTKRTLKRKEWLTMPPPGSGIVVHDVHREEAL